MNSVFIKSTKKYILICHLFRDGYVFVYTSKDEAEQKVSELWSWHTIQKYEKLGIQFTITALRKFKIKNSPFDYTSPMNMIAKNAIHNCYDGELSTYLFESQEENVANLIEDYIRNVEFQTTLFSPETLDEIEYDTMRKDYKITKLGKGCKMYSEPVLYKERPYLDIEQQEKQWLLNELCYFQN